MCVHEVQALFDAVETRFDPIDATVDAGQAFLDRGEAQLDVVNIVDETVELLVHAPQVKQKKAFGFVSHFR